MSNAKEKLYRFIYNNTHLRTRETVPLKEEQCCEFPARFFGKDKKNLVADKYLFLSHNLCEICDLIWNFFFG